MSELYRKADPVHTIGSDTFTTTSLFKEFQHCQLVDFKVHHMYSHDELFLLEEFCVKRFFGPASDIVECKKKSQANIPFVKYMAALISWRTNYI